MSKVLKTVTIVGIGALGSHLCQILRNEAQLRVIDFDRVSQKNTQSQFHIKPNVGKSKIQALSGAMSMMFGVKLETIPHKLTKQNDEQLLSKTDLVIDCLDNAEARNIVQAYARRTSTPCLHGALAPNGTFGRSVWDKHFVIDSEAGMGQATCEDGAHLPFIVLVSAYLARSAQEFLTTGKQVGFEVHPNGVLRT